MKPTKWTLKLLRVSGGSGTQCCISSCNKNVEYLVIVRQGTIADPVVLVSCDIHKGDLLLRAIEHIPRAFSR